MAYIGSIPSVQASAVRARDDLTCDGTQICFPLSQNVAGSFESNITVVLNHVLQEPVDAYTVINTQTLTLTSVSGSFTLNETVTGGTSSAQATVIKVNASSLVVRVTSVAAFSISETITGGTSGETATVSASDTNTGGGLLFASAPASASSLYVVFEGNATYDAIPSAGSVGPTQLTENLRNFTVDTFTGNGSTTTYSLNASPATANAIMVTVDGIYQTPTTNYSISGSDLIFTSAPDNLASITVVHLGFSTVSRTTVPDGSITTEKLAANEDWGLITGVVGSSLDFGSIA